MIFELYHFSKIDIAYTKIKIMVINLKLTKVYFINIILKKMRL